MAMTDSGATVKSPPEHAQDFFAEARANGALWSIRDQEAHTPLRLPDGALIVPFWSNPGRAHRFVDASPEYLAYGVVKVPLAEWRLRRWYPGLRRERVHARLNWSTRGGPVVDVSARELDAGLFPPARPVGSR